MNAKTNSWFQSLEKLYVLPFPWSLCEENWKPDGTFLQENSIFGNVADISQSCDIVSKS